MTDSICAFSGLTVKDCQDAICDCFTDGVDDETGGMGDLELFPFRFRVVKREDGTPAQDDGGPPF